MKRFVFESTQSLFVYTLFFVLLALITIFLLISPKKLTGIDVRPVSEKSFFDLHFRGGGWLEVRLYPDLSVSVNRSGRIPHAQLPAMMRTFRPGSNDVFLIADRRLPYFRVVQTIDQIRGAGKTPFLVLLSDSAWLDEKPR